MAEPLVGREGELGDLWTFASPRSFAVDSSGRTVIALYSERKGPFVARLLLDGHLDPEFGEGGIQFLKLDGVAIADIAVQNGVETVVLLRYPGELRVARLRDDGSFDATFGVNGVASGGANMYRPQALAVDSRGRVVFFGKPPPVDVLSGHRLEINGTLDPTFGINGTVDILGDNPGIGAIALGLVRERDGSFLIACPFGDGYSHVTRVDPQGLNTELFVTEDQAIVEGNPIALGPDGAIYVVTKRGLSRHLSNGMSDPSFADGGFVRYKMSGEQPMGWTVVVDRHGRPLLVGLTSLSNDNSKRIGVGRFRGDGSIDALYGDSGTVVISGGYGEVATTPDNRMMIAQFYADQQSGLSTIRVTCLCP